MFQLPWEQGVSWVALDAFDNGFKRLPNSPHNYRNGGAVDFAPRKNMRVGEDTSNFWVTAAAAGTVVEKSNCHLKINHGNGWITEYQFLANIQVSLGNAVYRNQRLAVIADGLGQKFCPPALEPDIPHLHFSLRPNMRGATFAGWTISYIPILNKTTFTKGDQSVGSYQPLSNVPGLQIVLRDPITWDTVYIGSVDSYLYERWPFVLNEFNKFTLTATPTTSGLTPLLILLDANGNEITRGTGTLTNTQSAGSYFVQVQPQAGSGFYELLLRKDDVPPGPFVSTDVTPSSINAGELALVNVSLNNVPSEGYTSAEFTCTYDANLVEVNNIVVANLFGVDAVTAMSGPQSGKFILAIAGSQGNKATTSGIVFTFNVKGLQAGQTTIECTARVSKGDNVLSDLPSIGTSLSVLGSLPTPTFTSTPVVLPTPTFTATPTSPMSNWLTFTNFKYGFEFKYPLEGQIVDGNTDNYIRIDLPFVQGTNLREKYLEAIVAENANPCRSPLATQSMLETSETVIINGISFLKETGGDGGAGNLHQWVAYSTLRDNACVSLDFILHSLNPGNFSTPPPVFDYTAESAVFGQIVSTYAWLTLVPTATPTFTSTPAVSPTPTFTPTPFDSPTPVFSPTATQIPGAILTGQVIAAKVITVRLYGADQSLVVAVNANPDGTFRFDVAAGTYMIVATANGFLRTQGEITLADGDIRAMPVITLPAGDIDDNNAIDQFDAMTIGMSYNTTEPPGADLNNDGIINVLDLELLARNYRKVGPLAWQ